MTPDARTGEVRAPQAVVPRPAATVMLLRDGTRGLEVLLLQRALSQYLHLHMQTVLGACTRTS